MFINFYKPIYKIDMSRPFASNYFTWRKSLLKDYVKRYNMSLPDLAKYKCWDYIDAIKKDRQFRNLLSKDYYSLLKTAQNNNFNIVGNGKKGRLLKRNLINVIKPYI